MTFDHSTYSLAFQCVEIILNIESIIPYIPISLCLVTCKFEKLEFGFFGIKGKVLMGEN